MDSNHRVSDLTIKRGLSSRTKLQYTDHSFGDFDNRDLLSDQTQHDGLAKTLNVLPQIVRSLTAYSQTYNKVCRAN